MKKMRIMKKMKKMKRMKKMMLMCLMMVIVIPALLNGAVALEAAGVGEENAAVKKVDLSIRKVIAGPFMTETAALRHYGGKMPRNMLVLKTSPKGQDSGYYVLAAKPLALTGDLVRVLPLKIPGEGYQVAFALNPQAAERMKTFTAANLGKRIAIVLDNRVLSAPTINGVIGKDGRISGNFSQEDVKTIARGLKLGMKQPGKKESKPAPSGDNRAIISHLLKNAFTGMLIKPGIEAFKRAFHPDCEFIRFGATGVLKQPYGHLLTYLERNPKPIDAKAVYKLLSLRVTGYAASALVEITLTGRKPVSHHLSLYKFKSGWQVVSIIDYYPDYKPPKERKAIAPDPGLYDSYVGAYTWGGGDMIHVTRKNNRLYLQTPAHSPVEIFPLSRTRFFSTMFSRTVTFKEVKDGKAQRLVFMVEGKQEAAAWRFQPKVAMYSGKKIALSVRKITAGPFASEKKALDKYGGKLAGDLLLLKSSNNAFKKGYYIVEARPVVTTPDLLIVKRERDPDGSPSIGLTLKPKAAKRMEAFSSKNTGARVAFILDNRVFMAPRIGGVISKDCIITGRFTEKEVDRIIIGLKLAIGK
jgi:hypothetical protein